ncbi:WhiB family transcriptional regulator [Microbacterium sp. ET2]|uniref:WhiB family transcriptional regulator n=1 Tax=Microbacterium albipurpureum TaxID=3050384 RepID=UPI00259CFA50|nr:WhiB family transcriptional regulator [Microbacterium sp. ET2 (Ac-2212)]WJL95863.1 WhiB family transcriptional regulator [Microbacterium sp. ET2 (Ac-2212)]
MSRADVAYRVLHDALAEIEAPACTGDDRFLLESHELAPEELQHLGATVCRPCPVRGLCRDYGNAARPPAGVWAGRVYPTPKRRTAKEDQL